MARISSRKPTRPLNVCHVSWVLHPHASNTARGPAVLAQEIPQHLQSLGINPSVIIPGHRGIAEKLRPGHLPETEIDISIASETYPCQVSETTLDGIPTFFVESSMLFDRENLLGEPDENTQMVFFSLGVLHFLSKWQTNMDVLVCHGWPTALIPAYIQTFGDRIFSGPVPQTIFYSYYDEASNPFTTEELAIAGLAIEHFGLPCPSAVPHIFADAIGQQFADQIFFAASEENPDTRSLAVGEISMYRSALPFSFQGMDQVKLGTDSNTWQIITPQEALIRKNPYLAQLIEAESIPPWHKDVLLTAIENGHLHIVDNITSLPALLRLSQDLRRVNWEQLASLSTQVKDYDPEKGLLAGDIQVLQPHEIEKIRSPAAPDVATGLASMPNLARITLAAGAALDFFGSPSLTPIGILPIEESGPSFLGVQAQDIHRAQDQYGNRILWYVMIPEGERGNNIRDHFDLLNHFGLDPQQVHFFEQEDELPLVDRDGGLFMNFARTRLLFAPKGHGQFFHAFRQSGMLDHALDQGVKQAFLSGSSNLGADISTDLFLTILGRHVTEGKALSIELVNQMAFEEGGIPVLFEDRPCLMEHFILSAQHQGEADYHGTPFNTNNVLMNLEALSSNHPYPAPLPQWARPESVRGRKYFRSTSVLGDATTLMPSRFVAVPRQQRYIHPLRMFLLDRAVRHYNAKLRSLKD